jgi:peptidoglycan hydrolase CwlO-like protein
MKKYLMILLCIAFLTACGGSQGTEQQTATAEEEIQLVDEISVEIDQAVKELHDEIETLSAEIDELLEDI